MFGIYLSPSMYIYQLSPCYVRMYGCSFFPPFFSYKIPTIHLVFVITHKYPLMNCVEKRFCKSKAVSLDNAKEKKKYNQQQLRFPLPYEVHSWVYPQVIFPTSAIASIFLACMPKES